MANVILRNRWLRQPTGPVRINGSHWAANALISASTFGLNYDHKQNAPLARTGTPETVTSPVRRDSQAPKALHPPGMSMFSDSTSNYLTRSFSADLNVEKIIVLARASPGAAASNCYIAVRDYDGVSVPFALFFDAVFAVGSNGAGFAFFDGGWRSAVGTVATGTGMRTVGGAYDGADIKGYLDGDLNAQTAYAGVLPTSSTNGVDFGRYGNESTVFNGFLEGCLIFDGSKIVASEYDYAVKSLSEEFYAIFQPLRRRLYVGPSAGGANQTVLVPAGNLTLTGQTPTVLTPRTVAAPAGALTLTGFAPTVTVAAGSQVVEVPKGNLTLTGNAPTVLTPRTVAVPKGELSLTGNAPTVTATQSTLIRVPAGTLVLTGYAPTVLATEVTPDVVFGGGRAPRVIRRTDTRIEDDDWLLLIGAETYRQLH